MSLAKNKDDHILDRLFCFAIGIGLIVFGVMAMVDRTYQSIVYGIIDLGRYHAVIGFLAIVLGAYYSLYITFKNSDIK